MSDITIEPTAYEFSIGSRDDTTPTHVGLHVITNDGRVTIPLALSDAEVVARLLQAHADYAAGREPRRWE